MGHLNPSHSVRTSKLCLHSSHVRHISWLKILLISFKNIAQFFIASNKVGTLALYSASIQNLTPSLK